MKRKALIIGIQGQIGSYLAEILLKKDYEVYGLVRDLTKNHNLSFHDANKIKLISGDLGDFQTLDNALNSVEPDELYNFGGISDLSTSEKNPEITMRINALSVTHICEFLKNFKKPVKFFQAGTALLFGQSYDGLVNEKTEFHPEVYIYSIAKASAFYTLQYYRNKYKMFAVNGIIFNSESSRRGEGFLTKKTVKEVCEIANGRKETLKIGMLDSQKDFSHAKDTANAAYHMMQAEKASNYIIASGETCSARKFIEEAFRYKGIEIEWKGEGLDEKGYGQDGNLYVEVDAKFFRPGEKLMSMAGDSTKLKTETAWKAEYDLKSIIKEMIDAE